MKARRSTALRAVAGILGAFAALLSTEVTCQATGCLVPKSHRDRHDLFWRALGPKAVIGYGPRPNIRGMELGWGDECVMVLDTDEHGWRNVGRNYDEARVWCVGDSFTFGLWVPRQASFAGVLERDLGPVLQLAAPGYSIPHYEAIWEEWAVKRRPSLVLLCLYANDFVPMPAERAPLAYPDAWLPFVSPNGSWAQRSLLSRLTRSRGPAWGGRFSGAHPDYPSRTSGAEARLSRMCASAASEKIDLRLVLLPSKESVFQGEKGASDPELQAVLSAEALAFSRAASLASAHGVPCIDLTRAFRASRSPHLYFATDSHWQPAGHELAAKEILQALKGSRVAGRLRQE